MKKTNILYWVFTGIFAAFMLFTSIPNALATKDWVDLVTGLGYPAYIVSFIGVAKVLGIIGILVPGFPRIKEWAYAGLTFDIVIAGFSIYAFKPSDPGWTFMLLVLLFLFLSYGFYHKRRRLKAQAAGEQPGLAF